MLLQSETELIRAVTRPNIFYRLSSAFLSLLIDNLGTYRIMLENAAYANHDVGIYPQIDPSYSSPNIEIVPSIPNSFPVSSLSPIFTIGRTLSSISTDSMDVSILLSATKNSFLCIFAMYSSPLFFT